jgi:hypothetical protein
MKTRTKNGIGKTNAIGWKYITGAHSLSGNPRTCRLRVVQDARLDNKTTELLCNAV